MESVIDRFIDELSNFSDEEELMNTLCFKLLAKKNIFVEGFITYQGAKEYLELRKPEKVEAFTKDSYEEVLGEFVEGPGADYKNFFDNYNGILGIEDEEVEEESEEEDLPEENEDEDDNE